MRNKDTRNLFQDILVEVLDRRINLKSQYKSYDEPVEVDDLEEDQLNEILIHLLYDDNLSEDFLINTEPTSLLIEQLINAMAHPCEETKEDLYDAFRFVAKKFYENQINFLLENFIGEVREKMEEMWEEEAQMDKSELKNAINETNLVSIEEIKKKHSSRRKIK